jgi:hypothetical protein
MGQAVAFAQNISIDMHKDYPEKTIRLQEVANVRYIPLGTTDDVLFNGTIVNLTDEGIAGFNKKDGDILVFEGNGKPIGSFNHVGQGPQDYLQIYHLDVDWKQGEVYVQDNFRQKIRIYAPDGSYLRTLNVQGTMRESDMYHFSDTHLIYYKNPDTRQFAPYQPVTLLSKKAGSTTTLPFTKEQDNVVKATGGPFGDMKMSAKHVCSLQKLGDEVYVNEVTADVIYRVEKPNALTPLIQRTPSYQETIGKDFFLMLTGANARYYFFKRQQALLEFKGNAATDTKSTYVAYDRKQKETIRPTFINNDYPSQDIPLDKLMQCAGSPNRCFVLMEAFKLKEALEEGKLKGTLKSMAEKLDEEDNPVVMVVEFKRF